jgi:hypothetical protein
MFWLFLGIVLFFAALGVAPCMLSSRISRELSDD